MTKKKYEDYFDRHDPEKDDMYWMLRQMYGDFLAKKGETELAEAQWYMAEHHVRPEDIKDDMHSDNGFSWFRGDIGKPTPLTKGASTTETSTCCYLDWRLWLRLDDYLPFRGKVVIRSIWKPYKTRKQAELALARALRKTGVKA